MNDTLPFLLCSPLLSSPLSSSPLARLGSDQLHKSIGAHGFGALQGEAQGSAPDQLGQDPQGAGHAEQHRVVVHLSHAVVLLRQTHRNTQQASGVTQSLYGFWKRFNSSHF